MALNNNEIPIVDGPPDLVGSFQKTKSSGVTVVGSVITHTSGFIGIGTGATQFGTESFRVTGVAKFQDIIVNSISMSGTINGRDISTDGSVLDSHISDGTIHLTPTQHTDLTDGGETSLHSHPLASNVVVGPVSAVDNNIAVFDLITGKIIKDGGSTISQVLNRANHTGTQLAATISDLDTEISNNTDVAANTGHRTSTGADHSYINQSVTSTSSPTFDGATFTTFPTTPSSAPTTDYQVSNKKYVDDSISSFSTTFLGLTDTISAYTANRILHTNALATELTDTASFTFDGSALNVPGNITLTGTVDGIDIATDVAANTGHRSSSGTDHTYIDQDVTISASPTFVSIKLNDTDSLFNLNIQSTSTITAADKTLTIDVNDSDRTLTISGDSTINQNVSTTGTPTFTSIQLGATIVVSSILDEDTLVSDSNTALATQQSIKAYVDSQVSSYDNQIPVNQVAHSLSIGNAIYNNAGTWEKAQSNDPIKIGIAIVVAVGGVDDFTYVSVGHTTVTAHGFATGNYLYVSASVAGLLTQTEPTGLPDYSNPLAYVIDSNTLLVFPWRPTQALPRSNDKHLISTVATTYNVSDDDEMVNSDATAGNVTINLPTPSATYNGFSIIVKKIDSSSNTVTIKCASGNIDGTLGTTGKVINAQYNSLSVVCDGTNYWIE